MCPPGGWAIQEDNQRVLREVIQAGWPDREPTWPAFLTQGAVLRITDAEANNWLPWAMRTALTRWHSRARRRPRPAAGTRESSMEGAAGKQTAAEPPGGGGGALAAPPPPSTRLTQRRPAGPSPGPRAAQRPRLNKCTRGECAGNKGGLGRRPQAAPPGTGRWGTTA